MPTYRHGGRGRGRRTPPAGSPNLHSRTRLVVGTEVVELVWGGKVAGDARRPARHTGADPARVWDSLPDSGPRPGARGSARPPLYPGPTAAYREWECALSPGVSRRAAPRYAGPPGPEGYALGGTPLGGHGKSDGAAAGRCGLQCGPGRPPGRAAGPGGVPGLWRHTRRDR